MIYYIVKDLKSGLHLPNPSDKSAATHVKLTAKRPPRLFTRFQDAQEAIHWWKGGEHFMVHSTNYDGEHDATMSNRQVLERADTQLVVVKVSIHKLKYMSTVRHAS